MIYAARQALETRKYRVWAESEQSLSGVFKRYDKETLQGDRRRDARRDAEKDAKERSIMR